MHVRGGGGGGGTAVRMDPGVAERTRARFRRHQEALLAVRDDVPEVVDLLEVGAGEFASVIGGGSSTFGASWGEAFGRTGRSAEIIADNVNNFALDLTRLDTTVVNLG